MYCLRSNTVSSSMTAMYLVNKLVLKSIYEGNEVDNL